MDWFYYIGSIGLMLAILLSLIRMVKGPTILDRVLSFDAIVVCVVGLIVLLSMQWNTAYFLELILVVSLLGFFTGVAFVFYLEETLDVEPMDETEPDQPIQENFEDQSGKGGEG